MSRGMLQVPAGGAAIALVVAAFLACGLAGCASQTIPPPDPAPVEAPINSLALEQCLKVNGPETCGA